MRDGTDRSSFLLLEMPTIVAYLERKTFSNKWFEK